MVFELNLSVGLHSLCAILTFKVSAATTNTREIPLQTKRKGREAATNVHETTPTHLLLRQQHFDTAAMIRDTAVAMVS